MVSGPLASGSEAGPNEAVFPWLFRIVPVAVHRVATSEVMRVIGNRMLEKWRENDRERWLSEGHEEGRQEGRREGHQEGRREGRQEAIQEAIEADRIRRPGETLEQAIERFRKERS